MSGAPAGADDRAALQAEWLRLTREVLPGLARSPPVIADGTRTAKHWPVRHDHCFQRILMDAACGGPWGDHVRGRPAYAAAHLSLLQAAVTLAHAVADGQADLWALNAASLRWRRAATRNAAALPLFATAAP